MIGPYANRIGVSTLADQSLTGALNELLAAQAGHIGRRVDADEASTQAGLQAAIPALLAALSGEAQKGTGLRQAIERDHDGSILDQLDDYLGGNASGLSPRTANGAGILDHVLGDRQEEFAQALSAKSGMSLGSIMQLLPMLAPIVLGMLGRKSSGGSGGFSLDDLGSILGGETESAHANNPDIGDILDSFSKGPASTTAGGQQDSSAGGLGGLLDSILGHKG
ncbi:MAG: DUF937 domain-containing protein [Chloroflexi bacterium]|nr:DUF937 domain-containing protein [Chloroflexota bacterium]